MAWQDLHQLCLGTNDKIRLQYVTQSCGWAEQSQGSRQDALDIFMANILYCLSSRDGILHAGCIVTSSLGCDSHVCASLQVLLCIAICALSTHTSTSLTVCCGGRALALHKARPWRHINNSALLPVGISTYRHAKTWSSIGLEGCRAVLLAVISHTQPALSHPCHSTAFAHKLQEVILCQKRKQHGLHRCKQRC